MKEIVISKKRSKTEAVTFLVCFLIACLLNVGAIVWYKSPALESITSLGYVFVFACCLYIVWSVIRLTAKIIKNLIIKK